MVRNAAWYDEYEWWMAVYTRSGRESTEGHFLAIMRDAKVAIPVGNVIFVQTSEKGKGPHYGAKSIEYDYDRFRGTQAQWNDYWNTASVPTPPPPGGDKPFVTLAYSPDEVDVELVEVPSIG